MSDDFDRLKTQKDALVESERQRIIADAIETAGATPDTVTGLLLCPFCGREPDGCSTYENHPIFTPEQWKTRVSQPTAQSNGLETALFIAASHKEHGEFTHGDDASTAENQNQNSGEAGKGHCGIPSAEMETHSASSADVRKVIEFAGCWRGLYAHHANVEEGDYLACLRCSGESVQHGRDLTPADVAHDKGCPVALAQALLATQAAASTAEEHNSELVGEAQRRMDAVVDAAVQWHQAEGQDEWAETHEALVVAINSLLELRDKPKTALRGDNRDVATGDSLPHLTESACVEGEPMMHGDKPYRWCATHNDMMLSCDALYRPEVQSSAFIRGYKLAREDAAKTVQGYHLWLGGVNLTAEIVMRIRALVPPAQPECTCFADVKQMEHATYCPREGMDFDAQPKSENEGVK